MSHLFSYPLGTRIARQAAFIK